MRERQTSRSISSRHVNKETRECIKAGLLC
jgi:hypothetical protein